LPKPGVDRLDLGGIENWLICHILRREAERLIRGSTTQPAPIAARG
jgi:hypothetical protein